MYCFTNVDRVTYPHNYHYTKFKGLDFLFYYFINRLSALKFAQTEDLYFEQNNRLLFFKNLPELVAKIEGWSNALNFLPMESKEQPLSADGIQKIAIQNTLHRLQEINNSKRLESEDIKQLMLFLRKFEISKKIYSSYDSKWQKGYGNYDNLNLYLLLSNNLGRLYNIKKSNQILSSRLKLNDLIISSDNSCLLNEQSEINQSKIIFKEMFDVYNLCKEKEIF